MATVSANCQIQRKVLVSVLVMKAGSEKGAVSRALRMKTATSAAVMANVQYMASRPSVTVMNSGRPILAQITNVAPKQASLTCKRMNASALPPARSVAGAQSRSLF